MPIGLFLRRRSPADGKNRAIFAALRLEGPPV
jgi:hypothetical protein